MRRIRIIFATCFILSVLALVGCKANDTVETSSGEEQAAVSYEKKEEKDDTLVLVEREIQSSFDPCIYPGSNHYIKNGVGELLFRVNPDGTVSPSLARDSKPIDKTTWELELRPEAKYFSGEPVTAKKVIGSLERSREKNIKAAAPLDGLTF
ncbi:MAG: hypothetical protein GXZ11_04985 [Tissierellia bacterium]|nr:hypothetical protein [Tissierellia bacterium]